MAAARPVAVVGPSGVGKSSLIKNLQEKCPGLFGFSVSHTTREPRGEEVDGVDYHFVSVDQFQEMLQQGEFIEHAEVHGNYYGTTWASVRSVSAQNRHCILDIDVQGCRIVRSSELDPFTIFIMPPTLEELQRRLESRGTDSAEVIQRRLGNAEREIAAASEPGLFDVIIVNDDLEQAKLDILDCLADEIQQTQAGAVDNRPADPTAGMTTEELLQGPPRTSSKIGYQVRREHPLYTTSANILGCKLEDGIPLPTKYYGVSGDFTKGFCSSDGCFWPNEYQGLDCSTHHDKVHRSRDYTSAYYLAGLKYGGGE
jgi:guanylate kinase